MDKKALISVSSLLSKKKEDDDNIEVVTPGKFYNKENYYYAVYSETEISGMKGTTTTFKIGKDNNKFLLIRAGTTSTKMEFKKRKDTLALYNTPYGTLELKINTKDLNIDVNDNGGDVFINYDMIVSGQKVQNTTLKIKIKAEEN